MCNFLNHTFRPKFLKNICVRRVPSDVKFQIVYVSNVFMYSVIKPIIIITMYILFELFYLVHCCIIVLGLFLEILLLDLRHLSNHLLTKITIQ